MENQMENQNSTTHEKRRFFSSLSKKRKAIVVIAVILLAGAVSRGFASHARARSFAGTGNGIALAVKDFESAGIVTAEASGTRRNGYNAAYDALMKEAAEKGADAIINVNITSTGIFNKTWSGAATAIKYLDAIPGETAAFANIANSALSMRSGRGFGRNRL